MGTQRLPPTCGRWRIAARVLSCCSEIVSARARLRGWAAHVAPLSQSLEKFRWAQCGDGRVTEIDAVARDNRIALALRCGVGDHCILKVFEFCHCRLFEHNDIAWGDFKRPAASLQRSPQWFGRYAFARLRKSSERCVPGNSRSHYPQSRH